MAKKGDVRTFAIIGSRGYPSTYGGFETFVRRFAPFLIGRGHQVVVYGRAGWRPLEVSRRNGVQVIATRGVNTKSLSTLTHGATATWNARHKHFDAALVLNVANGFYLPFLARMRIPSIMNVDGLEWQRPNWNRVGRAVFRAGANMSARHATAIVCDSRAIKHYWDSVYGVDSHYIPYGADLIYGPPAARIAELGLRPREYILVVARLVPENNVDLLLDAVEELPASIPLVIVGSGKHDSPLTERVQAFSGRRMNVLTLGHVKDQTLLSELWAHAGVYWHGHSVGGTNPALLQAMGAGSPILAFSSAFNREVLGSDDHLVGADPNLLAKRLLEVLQNRPLQDELARHGQRIAEHNYQWEPVCDAYLQLLLECADS